MSKKISIYNATYGKRLDEADRNDANMSMAQDEFENPDNDANEKVEKFNSGIHFGCEAFLKKGIRLSTVIAQTDSVVFALDPKRVAEVASRNGEFLALLNE